MKTKPETFSDQVRRCIKYSGKSLSEIAKATKISHSGICHFMARRQGMTLENLDKIAKLIGMKVSLVGESERKLFLGDCLNILPSLPEKSVDLILTDPPFGLTNNAWDKIIPFGAMWEQLMKVAKPHAAIILFGAEPFTSKLICSNESMFKSRIIWRKNAPTGHLNAKKMPMRATEDICVFYDQQPTYNPQKTTGHKPMAQWVHKSQTPVYGKTKQGHTGGGNTDRHPVDIVEFDVVMGFGTSADGKRLHPNQKPLALLEYLIKTYSNVGDTVLDFCMGSGSTGVAAKQTNRRFIGVESSKNYFEIAQARIEGAD